jgi:uncharacterized tellurite resistance protein B-like protein
MEPKIFKNLTTNQRKSIINLHTTVGILDGKINGQVGDIIAKLTYLCGVLPKDCHDYYVYEGEQNQLIKDLTEISRKDKYMLTMSIWDLIMCDGKPNESELSDIYFLIEEIGISEKLFSDGYDIYDELRSLFKDY